MKSTLSLWIAMSICILLASSCSRNTTKTNPDDSIKAFSEFLGNSIVIDLKGKILDTNQEPIENVKISIENKSVLTDNLGQFEIKNVSAHENLLVINVTKEDYKNEQINLSPEGHTITVNITLYKDSELSLFWFNKNNHNLPQTSIK